MSSIVFMQVPLQLTTPRPVQIGGVGVLHGEGLMLVDGAILDVTLGIDVSGVLKVMLLEMIVVVLE